MPEEITDIVKKQTTLQLKTFRKWGEKKEKCIFVLKGLYVERLPTWKYKKSIELTLSFNEFHEIIEIIEIFPEYQILQKFNW